MKSLIRQLYINKYRIKASNVKFRLLSRIGDDSTFEGNNRVGKYSFFSGNMGLYSYIGDNVMLMGVTIGRYTSISSNVRIINGRHPIKAPFVSSSPVFYSIRTPLGCSFVQKQLFEEYAYVDKENRIQVIIGNDCWIGYGVSIIGGVTIGDGAVVLANATVTKDVPPYAIVGGIPAKVLGYRYDENTISHLNKMQWWGKDEDWIANRRDRFNDIRVFLESE